MTSGTVLLDTNVFTAELNRRSPLIPLYAKHLIHRRVAIAPQTAGEARYGALLADWGQRRCKELEMRIARLHVLPVNDETVWSFANLRVACQRVGHPLHQKEHIGDLWIAATAQRWGIPLVAHDRIFINCPGLTLYTELR